MRNEKTADTRSAVFFGGRRGGHRLTLLRHFFVELPLLRLGVELLPDEPLEPEPPELPEDPELPLPVIDAPVSAPVSGWLDMLPPCPVIEAPPCEPLLPVLDEPRLEPDDPL